METEPEEDKKPKSSFMQSYQPMPMKERQEKLNNLETSINVQIFKFYIK